jgi:hydroxyacylglutathione hydrolase
MPDHAFKNINKPDFNLSAYAPPLDKIFKDNPIALDNAKIVKDNDMIKWKDHEIIALESPGHSAESMMYILHDLNCVFTGDTIFYLSVGRTDLPGGDFNRMIASINNLFLKVSDDYVLYPGHGIETTVEFEKKNNQFLKNY